MRWILTFRVRQYWQSSFWVIPVGCAALGVVLALAMLKLDQSGTRPDSLTYSEGTAVTLLAAIFAGTISFIGFVFTMLLLLPQFGGSQLSARVLHVAYRDPRLKLSIGVFVGTMMYTFLVMARVRNGFVPGLSLLVAGLLIFASVIFFLAFLSAFVHTLRPATAATRVAGIGRRVVMQVYPHRHDEPAGDGGSPIALPTGAPAQRLLNTGEGGVILAVAARGLVAIAEREDCLFVLPHAVGDYVATGTVILEVYGGRRHLRERAMRRVIALGPERTFEQDPAFALRILVDIAVKALSPAINDPTTAVHVVDRIEDLLVLLAGRRLSGGAFCGASGRPRLVAPMPDWEDYLTLAMTEIRQYGATSVQVVRRLRALLADLAVAVPAELRTSVEVELRTLDETVALGFPVERDRVFAAIGDAQGIGMGSDVRPRSPTALTT
jgi:uncharacterized membrane protein